MSIDRREFVKAACLASGSLLLPTGAEAEAQAARFPLRKKIIEGRSICPYCSVGCGVIIATDQEGRVVNTEGDPDHPINRGRLDPKSVAITQLTNSPLRLRMVQYRAAGSDHWEEKPWDWAIGEIAKRIKTTRDASFVERNVQGLPVNRTEAIAWLGGAANNNEDCYLGAKLMRALGVVYLEHQARV
jgi:formate dehydrogenase major subunit